MNHVEHNGWLFSRHIGQGEIENVRSLLLQVTAFSTHCLNAQVAGMIRAANKLDMRARIFINAERLGDEQVQRLIQTEFKHAKEHDLIELSNTQKAFDSTISRVDVTIISGSSAITAEEVCKAIVKLWTESGGRGSILHARGIEELQILEIRKRFPLNIEALRRDFFGELNADT